MPQAGVTSPTAPIAARAEPKKKKREEETPSSRLQAVEQSSQGVLGSRYALALMETSFPEKELRRTARQLAKQMDLPPLYLFDKTQYADHSDPVWGGPVRLSTLQRMAQDGVSEQVVMMLAGKYADPKTGLINLPSLQKILTGPVGAAVIRGVIETKTRTGEAERLPTGRLEKPTLPSISAADVAEHMSALAKVKGERFTVPEALAISADLARRGVDSGLFEQNLRTVDRWAMSTGQYSGAIVGRRGEARRGQRPSPMSVMDAVALAASAAQMGDRFENAADVVRATTPGLVMAEQTEAGAGLEAVAQKPLSSVTPGPLASAPATAPQPLPQAAPLATEAIEALATLPTRKAAQKIERLYDITLLSGQSNNWFKAAQSIAKDIEMDKTAWQRTWWGKATSELITFFQDFAEVGEAIATDVVGGTGHAAGLISDENWVRAMQDSQAIMAGQKNLPDVWEEQFGIPQWVGVPAQFLVWWYADPLVIGGRALRAIRMPKVAPGTAAARKLNLLEFAVDTAIKGRGAARGFLKGLSGGDLARFAEQQATKATRESAGKTFAEAGIAAEARQQAVFQNVVTDFAEKTADELMPLATNPVEWTRKLRRYRTFVSEQTPFDESYMYSLQQAAAQTVDLTARRDLLRDGLVAHFTQVAPPGSIIEQLLRSRHAIGRQAVKEVTPVLGVVDDIPVGDVPPGLDILRQSVGGPAVPPATLIDDVLENITQDSWSARWQQPLRLEVPTKLGVLPFTGGVKRGFMTLGESFRGTAGGRQLDALVNINPGSIAKLEQGQERYTRLYARRWTEFNDAEIIGWERRMTAAKSAPGREAAMVNVLNAIEEEGARRFLKKIGVPADLGDDMLRTAQKSRGEAKEELFGVVNDELVRRVEKELGVQIPSHIRRALGRSELRNFHLLADPVAFRRVVRDMVGTGRRMEQALRRAFGKIPRELAPETLTRVTRRAMWNSWREGRQQAIGLWKWGAVARPAYIFRVVLGDELARQFAVNQSFFEWMIAAELKGRAFGGLGVLPKGKRLGDFLDETGLGTKQFYLYDEAGNLSVKIDLPRPGGTPREPLANSTVSQRELAEGMMGSSKKQLDGMGFRGNYRRVEKENPQHLKVWAGALNNGLGYSDAGKVALASIARGDGLSQTYEALRGFSRTDVGKAELRRIGMMEADEVDQWAAMLTAKAHGYTLSKPELARTAYLHEVSTDILERTPLEARPPVHGPSLDMLAGNRRLFDNALVEKTYEWFVRNPENILNRQRFYRVWKGRAESAYLSAFRESQEAAIAVAPKKGFVRLYRGESQKTRAVPGWLQGSPAEGAMGRWFTADLERARWYVRDAPDGHLTFVDVPRESLDAYRVTSQPELKKFSGDVENEFFLPADVAGTKMPLGARPAVQEIPQMTPATREAISSAARDFSLAQNKKIMFDFTENSRLGEMLGWAFPFSQPFAENIAVWGHIALARNPALLGYVNVIGRLAHETGFARRDENGQLVIPLSWWAMAGPILNMATGQKGFQLVAPLSSLNMFWNSAFEVPVGDASIPLPVPGTAPWAGWFLQKMFEDTDSPALRSWLFKFGPGPESVGEMAGGLLPRWLADFTKFANPDWDKFADSTAIDFLRMQQYGGQEPDAKLAKTQSRWMALARIFLHTLFPTSPHVRFPQAEKEDELHRLQEKYGFDLGREMFISTYPDLSLLTIGKTYWARQIGTEQVGEEAPRAPRVPASKTAQTILSTPGFKEFAQRHPAWAAAIVLVSGEHEFDPGVFAQQIASGQIKYKTPADVLEADQFSKGWEAVHNIDTAFDVAFEQLRDRGLSDENIEWKDLRLEQSQALAHVAAEFPIFGRENLDITRDENGDVVTASIRFTTSSGKPIEVLNAEVRQLLESDLFLSFPAGKGLKAYVDGRDAIEEDMAKAGVTSLHDPRGEQFKARYDSLVTDTTSTYPDFKPFYDSFFDNDLYYVRTEGARILQKWRTAPEGSDLRQKYERFKTADTVLEAIQDETSAALTTSDRNSGYQRQRDYLDNLWRTEGKAFVTTWFKNKSAGLREQYMHNLATLPPIFMSRLDLSLMGIDISDQAASALSKYGRGQLAIDRDEEAGLDVGGSRYDALNRDLAAAAKGDKTLQTFIEANSTWGWGIERLGYTKGNGKAPKVWRTVLDWVGQFQGVAKANDWHGSDVDFPGGKVWRQAQATLADWVENDLFSYSKEFETQWKDLQGAYGNPLTYLLLPHSYWPI